MADEPIPGLEPEQGRLDSRYAKWLGACRTCRAPILWATSTNGKPMPVDARPTPEGNLALHTEGGVLRARVTRYDPNRYIAHFATCPDANRHRKARR